MSFLSVTYRPNPPWANEAAYDFWSAPYTLYMETMTKHVEYSFEACCYLFVLCLIKQVEVIFNAFKKRIVNEPVSNSLIEVITTTVFCITGTMIALY